VNAVRSVVDNRQAAGAAAAAPASVAIEKGRDDIISEPTSTTASARSRSEAPQAQKTELPGAGIRPGWTHFAESFVIQRPPQDVWNMLCDFRLVASCLPGAELTEQSERHVKGRMAVKLGPIRACFAGSASVELQGATLSGHIRGAGSDNGTGSRTRADAIFRVEPDGADSRVSVEVEYNLQGALAQFSRSGLAQDLGRRLVGEFAANLNAGLGPKQQPPATGAFSAPLDASGLVWTSLKAYFHKLLARLIGRPERPS
jgi:carbon-monoxide dehydrogenase small subunit